MSKDTHYCETRFGFEYGALSVERLWSRNGYVCIRLVERRSKKAKYVDVYCSPTGKVIKVYRGDEESG